MLFFFFFPFSKINISKMFVIYCQSVTIKQEARSSEAQIVSPLFLTVFLTVIYILLFKSWEK